MSGNNHVVSPSSLQSRAVSQGKLYFRIHSNFFLSFLKQQVSRFQKALVTELFPHPPIKLYVGAHVLSLPCVRTWRGGRCEEDCCSRLLPNPCFSILTSVNHSMSTLLAFCARRHRMLLSIAYAVRSCPCVWNTCQNSAWHVCTHFNIMVSFFNKMSLLGFQIKIEAFNFYVPDIFMFEISDLYFFSF